MKNAQQYQAFKQIEAVEFFAKRALNSDQLYYGVEQAAEDALLSVKSLVIHEMYEILAKRDKDGEEDAAAAKYLLSQTDHS